MRILSVLALLASASPLAAQELPPYVPSNPALTSRSALYAQPMVRPSRGWRVRTVIDYANAVEVTKSTDRRDYAFDAETLEGDLWISRDLSPRTFVIGDIAVRGGYAGFMDGFLNWYHDLIGLKVPARNQRTENRYTWAFTLPDGQVINRERPGTFLGDARVGAGVRFGRSQLVAAVTLPTAGAAGWGREVVGSSLALTTRLADNSRLVVEGGATAGYTPTAGSLAAFQRSTFVGGQLASRWRFSGRQALFATLWMQSPSWKNTGFATLDDAEVTLDFGGLVKLGQRWPEIQIGMTEDLVPRGPAVDAGFKLGLRWR
ncbi:MAG: DUF3187 family protein [Gemmatimonadota bacterium]